MDVRQEKQEVGSFPPEFPHPGAHGFGRFLGSVGCDIYKRLDAVDAELNGDFLRSVKQIEG